MPNHPLTRQLHICAAVIIVLTVAMALLAAMAKPEVWPLIRIIPAMLVLMLGLGLAAILFGLAAALQRPTPEPDVTTARLLAEIRDQMLRTNSSSSSNVGALATDRSNSALPESERVIQLLEEIRDISLMNEAQRQEKLIRLTAARRQSVVRGVDDLIQQKRWAEARNLLLQGLAMYGGSEELTSVQNRLAHSCAIAEAEAFAALQHEVVELQGAGNWEEALARSQGFLQQFPQSPNAQQYHANLLAARDASTDALANQLYDQVAFAVEQRAWRRARSHAQRLLEKCPQHLRAQQVNTQLALIRDNADVEQRNEMEAKIHELVRAGKIKDGIAVAEELIAAYPLSPQAQIASQLVERLRNKIVEPPAV